MSNSRTLSPIVGFQTAHGSLYRYDEKQKMTRRFKVSSGSGQGCFDRWSLCFFLTSEQKNHLQKNFLYQLNNLRYRFGFSGNGEQGLFIDNKFHLPEGTQSTLYIYDDYKKQYVFAGVVDKQEPAVGLTPLEKVYYHNFQTNERMGSTHMGHSITKVYMDENIFQADLTTAQQKFQNRHRRRTFP
jgi:hypothetical protein